tara:strand:- start:57 stop:323 length:267 start_codon:yes stop_codon:yes gene_type:complete
MKIRTIVRASFKVDELRHQFQDIDVPDGLLENGSIEEVNEKYSDEYIIEEARNRLLIAMDECNQEEEEWQRDARQLRQFIKRFSNSNR